MAETTQPETDTPLDPAEWHAATLGGQVVGEFSEERQLDCGSLLGESAISAAPKRRWLSGADR